MGQKKVLFIAPLPPPVHGSAMMSQYIKDSKIINDSFQSDFVNLSTSRKMNEIGKFSISKICRFVSAYFIVFWKLLTHRYDICYLAITCHGVGFLKDMPFVWLAKLFAKQVVIHQHNKGMSSCVNRWPYKWLLPFTYKNTKVILLSWHLYKDIAEVVQKEQILICPNGIEQIDDAINADFQDGVNVPHLLFLSNLIPSKGVYGLLDACEQLKNKGYQFICAFVGGETKEISRLDFEVEVKKRSLSNICIYYGPKYGPDKDSFLKWADLFVFPTFYFNECFPLVILEAMQYQLPVVTTNEGGIPDIVENGVTGLVCERKNVESLANALEQLILDKERRIQMGQRGFLRYQEKFTLPVFEQNMAQILRSL